MNKLLLLATLTGCSSVGMQTANLALNVPGYKNQMEMEEKERITCLKEARCISFWDAESKIFLVHKITPEEFEDIKTTEDKEAALRCVQKGLCQSYRNRYFNKTLIHKFSESE